LGYDINSIPEGLLNIMNSIDLGGDGTIQLIIDEPRLEEAREILSNAYDGVVSFDTTGSSVIIDVVSEPAQQEGQPVEEDNVEEEDVPADENTCEEAAADTERRMVDPSQIEESRIANEEQIYAAISQAVGGESVNIAKQLDDSLKDFNIHFNKAIALKRRIEDATKRFSETSPDIINLVEQANGIVENYELVNEVYFTNDEIVFITIPLVTDDRLDGHKRHIGIMRLGVRIDALFSPNPTGQKKAVSIRNLTHRHASSNGAVWECGHVQADGGTCFGTAFNAVFDALSARDLVYVVESLIRFIKTPNPDDSWGYHMKYWPEAQEDNAHQTAENQ